MRSRIVLVALCLATLACGGPAPPSRPNVLWVVWDTVRADHMSLYGYEYPTTPHLDAWAESARVYEDCRSTAGYTLPAHASMFTGLLPSEHCTHNGHQRLDDVYATLPELLHGAGYQTYMFSANPFISELANFTQGFDQVEHPWSEPFRDRALEIVRESLRGDHTSELSERLEAAAGRSQMMPWNIKAAGELAEDAVMGWLDQYDARRPYFVFLNYMEAHRPCLPPQEHRAVFMTDDEVQASYQVDRSWTRMWEYVFGLTEFSEPELDLTRKTYDATIHELDAYLASLLATLEAGGYLENTIVVVTSDHGEHLGEHHLLDHQYSLYEEVLKVPLIVRYPPRLEAGRDARPAMNFDLFPTLLELTGTPAPEGSSHALSLLSPSESRLRLSEEPATTRIGLRAIRPTHPDFDVAPWLRSMQALHDGGGKFIWSSNGHHELYDLVNDPEESHNLQARGRASSLEGELFRMRRTLAECLDASPVARDLTPEERARLRALGYAN